MLLSRNLDQNMQKNALLFGKKRKIAETLGLRPQTPELLPPSSVTVTFEEGVCSANVIAVQKDQKELRNTGSNNVLLLPFISYFALQTLRRVQTPLAQISRHRNNYDLYFFIFE